ncbi:class I SAM-dependent methyltransferase [Jiangella alkaliphila]|uniref:Methyltransferase domain-containing protein n=1 Tax=Jiangella alkaliphila TaxID=419479 RepID=A0A1H2KXZ9_9ACTN|nr:class I SAM-dependent methyltransferase [Jiangella alkaliphila]SDU73465.1 Methyltransferase domain-containing protein [Jiangella alkaliphila]
MDFIDTHLPPAPARILDAGCGDGALADRLRERGYDVTAIDIDPERARPGVRTADICDFRDDPYDAVVFALSLHHVDDLGRALDSAAALLREGGRLLIDEFAHERAGTAIADLFYDQPGSLSRWRDEHRDLHTGAAMVDAVAGRFTIASLASVPYLYRYLEDETLRDTESVLGLQLVGLQPADVPAGWRP